MLNDKEILEKCRKFVLKWVNKIYPHDVIKRDDVTDTIGCAFSMCKRLQENGTILTDPYIIHVTKLCLSPRNYYHKSTPDDWENVISITGNKKKQTNRVFSDMDPYGEENWD